MFEVFVVSCNVITIFMSSSICRAVYLHAKLPCTLSCAFPELPSRLFPFDSRCVLIVTPRTSCRLAILNASDLYLNHRWFTIRSNTEEST